MAIAGHVHGIALCQPHLANGALLQLCPAASGRYVVLPPWPFTGVIVSKAGVVPLLKAVWGVLQQAQVAAPAKHHLHLALQSSSNASTSNVCPAVLLHAQ